MREAGPDVEQSARRLLELLGSSAPDALLVLGSGLSGLVEALDAPAAASFAELGWPSAGVAGHQGRWVAGGLEGRRVLVQAGRYHLYEGWPVELVCAPLRLAAALGARTVVLTNASGGIRPDLGPGSIVLLEDHLNLTGRVPPLDVRGGSPRTPVSPYAAPLRDLAGACARELGVDVARGVYAGLTGPSYETPAEVRMLAAMGADVVGMSTVLEAGTAAALGLKCLGVSLVTNHAAGRSPTPLRHAEVLEIGARSSGVVERLLRAFVRRLPA